MRTSLKDFRAEYLEALLDFMWRQWCQLGVAGYAKGSDNWVMDPEALLLLTLEVGRSEPRMFDEVLDWLVRNGCWMNVRKLRNLAKADKLFPNHVLAAIAEFLSKGRPSAKWRMLSGISAGKAGKEKESIFLRKDGSPFPIHGKEDPLFLRYGISRPPPRLRGMTQPVPILSGISLLLRIRAFFGIDTRAEVLAYLLTHNGGHPRGIAREVGFSQKSVQDCMVEMANSELIHVRPVGKEKHYRLANPNLWRELLGLSGKTPIWVPWIHVFRGLVKVWRRICSMEKRGLTIYLQSSEFRELMTEVRPQIEITGLEMTDHKHHLAESYLDVFMDDLRRVLRFLKGKK